MACLRKKDRSPYWFACFTLPDGRRTQRSTRVPYAGVQTADIRQLGKFLGDLFGAELTIPEDATGGLDAREAKRLAERIANHFEDAAIEARAGNLTELQARKVIADIFAVSNHDSLQSSTIKDFCESWLKRKELEAGEKTHVRYEGIIEDFLAFLGPRATRDIAHLSAKDIAAFRDSLARRLTPGTANISLKVVRSALAQARRDGLIDVNEAERVTLLKNVRTSARRPFKVAELKGLLKAANEEWRGMILTGLYTGLRLSDVATLLWSNVDLKTKEISVVTGKTGRRQILPLAKPLLGHLKSLPNGESSAPLFPTAHAARQRSQYGGTLSNQFYNILVAAGLAKGRTHEGTGKGRDAKRDLGGLSFHCLRHTATSLMKNAGVSDAIARDIIGHDSPAVSANYTHIDTKTKRTALNRIPNVLK